jgi:membrane fusion protein, multidrug efflux system
MSTSTEAAPASGPPSPKSVEPCVDAVSAPRNGVRRRRILLGVGVVALLALGVLGYWFFFMRGFVFTDDARFAGHLVDLAPEISGTLLSVPVHEGRFIRKGTPVFQLDPALPNAALQQAEAALNSARASLSSSEAKYAKAVNGPRPEEVKAAAAILHRLEGEEDMARRNFERVQSLFQQNSVSTDDLDRARTAQESARQSRENATQTLRMFEEGSRSEDIASAKADVELARSRIHEAESAVENSRRELARCEVKAPFDGWVVRRWLEPGAMPLTAQPVVSMFDPATLRVDANIEERFLHEVAIGDEVDLTVDAFPSLHLRGRVTEILRATNSQFSLIPAEGVSGTFIKVTQRVPLRISVPPLSEYAIGPGLSVEVRIRSGSAGTRRQESEARSQN